MTRQQLFEQILKKRSFLCVGLDTDADQIPRSVVSKYKGGEIFEFNKAIIDATAPYAVCYKPNLAFYEAYGQDGMAAFVKTCAYVKAFYPEIFVIADAKRGDIGNTSEMYARSFFDGIRGIDGVTLSPYMGRDTVDPFLKYSEAWAIVLALTSNPSAADFEMLKLENGKHLYEQVLETSSKWGNADNTMYVVGATKARMLEGIRKIVPDHFLLVPGVGAQGGSLEEVAKYGMNKQCGLLVNSSRGIIYADSGERFAEASAEKACEMRDQMDKLLEAYL